MAVNKPTRVVYIGGSGRSGSTLLEMFLAQINGVVAAGELRRVWAIGVRRNHLCSCGSRFRECSFWQRVFERAFGGIDEIDLELIENSAARLARIRNIPKLAGCTGFAEPDRQHRRYFEILGSLYAAVAETSRAELVVDSSKSPAYGFLLAGVPRIELYVVHLVRDSRAVAFSWRRHKERGDRPEGPIWMPVYSHQKSALKWMLDNLLVATLRNSVAQFVRLRYEDLATNPRQALGTALLALGLPEFAERLVARDSKAFKRVHSVMGNPVRFERGPLVVTMDREWQSAMQPSARRVVTFLTAPLLKAFRYPVLHKRPH